MGMNHLGPYPAKSFTGFQKTDEYIRCDLVAKQNIPIILSETHANGTNRFAVLAPPNKELRVVCAGCYEPGMSLFDDTKCKKVSSFSQHWDLKQGKRKYECNCRHNENTFVETEKRVEAMKWMSAITGINGFGNREVDTAVKPPVDLHPVSTEDLIDELKRRNEVPRILSWISDMEIEAECRDREESVRGILMGAPEPLISDVCKQRAIPLLYNTEPEVLLREMHRQTTSNAWGDIDDYEQFHFGKRRPGDCGVTASDYTMDNLNATIKFSEEFRKNEQAYNTRSKKRQKTTA